MQEFVVDRLRTSDMLDLTLHLLLGRTVDGGQWCYVERRQQIVRSFGHFDLLEQRRDVELELWIIDQATFLADLNWASYGRSENRLVDWISDRL